MGVRPAHPERAALRSSRITCLVLPRCEYSAPTAARDVPSRVTRRGVSHPGAGVMAGCISAGARSRSGRRQSEQHGLCRVRDECRKTLQNAATGAGLTRSMAWTPILPDEPLDAALADAV